jgi:hypothetical protein
MEISGVCARVAGSVSAQFARNTVAQCVCGEQVARQETMSPGQGKPKGIFSGSSFLARSRL